MSFLTVVKRQNTLFYSYSRWNYPVKALNHSPQTWTQMYHSNFLYIRFKNQLGKLENGEVFEIKL